MAGPAAPFRRLRVGFSFGVYRFQRGKGPDLGCEWALRTTHTPNPGNFPPSPEEPSFANLPREEPSFANLPRGVISHRRQSTGDLE
jgi:hypothetical protein